MTATCTLCGLLITAEPDGILDQLRDDRTLGRMGATFRSHLEKHHAKEPQRALPPEVMKGNIGGLIQTCSVTSAALVLFSYLKSEDALFVDKVGKMREIVVKAIEQKEPVSVIQGVSQ